MTTGSTGITVVGNRPTGRRITTAAASWVTASRPVDVVLADSDVIWAHIAFNSDDTTAATHASDVAAPDSTWILAAGPRKYSNGASGTGVKAFYHIVTNAGTEPTTYTFTPNASARGTVVLAVYRGMDTATPLEVSPVTTPSADTSGGSPACQIMTSG